MKKRFLSILLSLCMVLALVPVTAFAEDNEEPTETPVCICEAACAAEAMNTDCPVCGAEGATIENCGKYEAPVEETEPEQTAVEKVQAMLDALPTVEELEAAEEATVNAAYEAAQAVYDALEALSPEDQEQITGVEKLMALMDWFNGQVEVLVEQPPVSYVDENGETQTCNDYTIVTSETSSWGENGKTTWYVVSENVSLNDRLGERLVNVTGDVRLILCDSATLTVTHDGSIGLVLEEKNSSLTIYGQTEQSGRLSVTGGDYGYGIWNNGTLTINGGVVEATGAGKDFQTPTVVGLWNNGTLTINGGEVTCTGKNTVPDTVTHTIGLRSMGTLTIGLRSMGTLTIRGGTVTATTNKADGKALQLEYDISLPDSYKWCTVKDGDFTQHICTLAHYVPGEENYVQIVVPGDVPYHDFGTWIDEVSATCLDNGVKGHKDCTRCEKHFDVDGVEITDLTIKATGHTQKSEWRYDQKEHWKLYPCCNGKTTKATHSFGADGKCVCGAVQYTVTFDPNGGSVDTTTATTESSGKIISLPTPERDGYQFTGWFTEKAGGTEVTETTVFTAHTTVYAQWSDNVAPTISGIENGKTYCKEQTVTVTDDNDIASVTVNGTPITLDANGQFTLSPAKGTQTVVVTDKADNKTEITVTVNDGHDYESKVTKEATTTSTGTKTYTCKNCGHSYEEEIAKLPSQSTSPQTGDNSHMALWFALILLSGGALAGTAVYGKKRKHSAK